MERNRNIGSPVDINNNPERSLENVRSKEHLTSVNLVVTSALIKTLETQVIDIDAKYAKIVDEMAHTKEDVCLRINSMKSLLKVSKNCIAQSEKDPAAKVAGDKDVVEDRLGAYDAVGCQLKKRDNVLYKAHVMLTTAVSGLERLHGNAKDFDLQLLAFRADAALQSLLCEESRQQLDARSAELKKLQPQLQLKTMC